MKYLPVDSSDLHGMAYDPEEGALYVQFKSGAYYKYDQIDPGVVTGMMFSDSVGKAFNQSIRSANIPGQRLDTPDLEKVGLAASMLGSQGAPNIGAPTVPPIEDPQLKQPDDQQAQQQPLDVNNQVRQYPIPGQSTGNLLDSEGHTVEYGAQPMQGDYSPFLVGDNRQRGGPVEITQPTYTRPLTEDPEFAPPTLTHEGGR